MLRRAKNTAPDPNHVLNTEYELLPSRIRYAQCNILSIRKQISCACCLSSVLSTSCWYKTNFRHASENKCVSYHIVSKTKPIQGLKWIELGERWSTSPCHRSQSHPQVLEFLKFNTYLIMGFWQSSNSLVGVVISCSCFYSLWLLKDISCVVTWTVMTRLGKHATYVVAIWPSTVAQLAWKSPEWSQN